ncbi:patatin-like phospholipase family protein [Effusibacillus pohliae]|uniref:patatin-like phospholipase family protein n=1 Tax=Effusibacillus pohliae TaxID=232270 RepID=UPI00037760C4|nr:patatin-like phospholipase family protein [Effusibacillus pohliae]
MKRVGLALGGGAVRGLAHIGVLKVLQRHQIPIHYIAGTSMGGLIGGLVAAGIAPEEIEEFIYATPTYRLVDFAILKRGILAGDKIYTLLIQMLEQKGLGDVQIEDLPITFRAVSVDLKRGQIFLFERGSLLLAIRATTSIPGLFAPVAYQDKVLVDGGILNNLPADLARREGVDAVVAVDVEREHEEQEPRNIFEVLYRSYSIMTTTIRRANLRYADVVLRPRVGHILAFDFSKVRESIEAGERAAERKLKQVAQLLE